MRFRIELGSRVRDQITGFEGVVTGRVEYLTGCAQYLVQPAVKKDSGEWIDARWLDEDRLDETADPASAMRVARPGADQPAPVR